MANASTNMLDFALFGFFLLAYGLPEWRMENQKSALLSDCHG
jgi:hypothetical protein